MKRKTTIELIAGSLILLFVYAAVSKLIDYHRFIHFLQRIKLFAPFALQIAWLLPMAELIIAALLIVRETRLAGFYASFFLMLSFIAYLSLTLAFGKEIPCSCGGILQGLKWGPHIVFNTFFLALAFCGIHLQLKERGFKSIDKQPIGI